MRIKPSSLLQAVFLFMVCYYSFFCISCSEKKTGITAIPEAKLADDSIKPIEPKNENASIKNPYMDRARAIVENWDVKALAGQLIMTGLDNSSKLEPNIKTLLKEIKPGAVLLFKYNIDEKLNNVFALCRDAGEMSKQDGILPFIALDHEGGRVYRFKSGLTRLPGAAVMGQAGKSVAALGGSIAGSELRALGISMNLAPVVEAAFSDDKSFIGDRAWSSSFSESAVMTSLFIKNCEAEGVAAVAKHFPGSSNYDPHEERASVLLETTNPEHFLIPFAAAIKESVAAIMLSHVIAEFLDPSLPVSVSPLAISFLKNDMNFRGIVISDDLEMAALNDYSNKEPVAILAIKAGVDLIMISSIRNALTARDAILKEATESPYFLDRIKDAAARIVAQKLRFGLDEYKPSAALKRFSGLETIVEYNSKKLRASLIETINQVK